MTIKQYTERILSALVLCFGTLMLILLAYATAHHLDSIATRMVWAMGLTSCAVVFRLFSLINFNHLKASHMRINYMITSMLADLTLLSLLYYFTPGGQYFKDQSTIILIVYIISKLLIYVMLYYQSVQSAKAINAQLAKRG